MQTLERLIVLGFLTVFVSACASSRYTVIEPPQRPIAAYHTLVIHDFKSNLTDADSLALAGRFADKLYAAVLRDRVTRPGETIFTEVTRKDTHGDGVLVLDGTVISFEKGSRAKRYWIGFGAGKAYCTVRSVFTDETTAETVLEVDFDGELAMGVFGGSDEEAVDAVVRAYIDYFKDYFARE